MFLRLWAESLDDVDSRQTFQVHRDHSGGCTAIVDMPLAFQI